MHRLGLFITLSLEPEPARSLLKYQIRAAGGGGGGEYNLSNTNSVNVLGAITTGFNPIDYGILTFSQLRVGGYFYPTPRKKVTIT